MKRILFVLLVTISCFKTFGQDSKMSFGIEMIPTTSWLRGNIMNDIVDSRFGYSVGLNSMYSINSQFSLKSGLNLERKGSMIDLFFYDSVNPLGKVYIHTNFDYLILPILGSFSTKGEIKFYLNMGPYIGYLINQEYVMSSFEDTPEHKQNGLDEYKKFDLGMSIGTGLFVPFSEMLMLDFGLKADFGLLNISKTEIIDNGTIKTNSFGLLVGLKYKI